VPRNKLWFLAPVPKLSIDLLLSLWLNFIGFVCSFVIYKFLLPTTLVLWCDNVSALALTSNLIDHALTKHIEVDYHFVQEKVINRDLLVKFISSKDQVANLFTKGLPSVQFQFLQSILMVLPPSISLQGGVNVNNVIAFALSPKNENNTSAVQGVVRFHLPNEDHLLTVNHERKEMSVAVNNLAAVGDTKKGRSLTVNHTEMKRRDNLEYGKKYGLPLEV
jgi:hypothetical protein